MTGRQRPGRHGRLGPFACGKPGLLACGRQDRGFFTAELAVGLPALMILLCTGVTAVNAVTTHSRCVAAAREGAVIAARGGSGVEAAARVAPGAAVSVRSGESETVAVTVLAEVDLLGAHLPSIEVSAKATAAREPGVVL